MENKYMRTFRAFTDENRLRVLELLCKGEKCGCILQEELDISQPTFSYHMKILCDSGIVKSRRVGKWNHYAINQDGCEYAGHLVEAVLEKKMPALFPILYGYCRLLGYGKRLFTTKNRQPCLYSCQAK